MKYNEIGSYVKYVEGLIVLIVLALMACSDGKNGQPGSSCSVSQVEEGALISCTNGSAALIPGSKADEDETPTEGCKVKETASQIVIICGPRHIKFPKKEEEAI